MPHIILFRLPLLYLVKITVIHLGWPLHHVACTLVTPQDTSTKPELTVLKLANVLADW